MPSWLERLSQDMAASASNPLLRGSAPAAPQPPAQPGWLAGSVQGNQQANPLLGSTSPPATAPASEPISRDDALRQIHAKAGMSDPFAGKLHVVLTHHDDRTTVHGIFADRKKAAAAHEAEIRKRFSPEDFGDEKHSVPMMEALLSTHGRKTARIHSIENDGPMPSEVSLVHEGILHPYDGESVVIHHLGADHAEAERAGTAAAKAFWNNGHQSLGGPGADGEYDDDASQPFPGLAKANKAHRDNEHISQGEMRSGIIKVTRHAVIA